MRTRTLALVAVTGLLGLSACASTGGPYPTYAEELAALEDTCQARGGILTPLPGASGHRPATDYACEIRGGSGRLN
ncbi:MAG: hypothetical protein J0L52_02835 [Caulobacterales bacterium]|nr:hypothetical protein [Caulobacterales bacterium]